MDKEFRHLSTGWAFEDKWQKLIGRALMVTCKLYVNDYSKNETAAIINKHSTGQISITKLNTVYVIETSHYTMTISTIVIEQMFIFCHGLFTYQF